MLKYLFRVSIIIAVALLLAFSIWIRMGSPGPTELPFYDDSAYHFRITSYTIQNSKIPDRDLLYVQEPARNPRLIYTPILYYVHSLFARGFHRLFPERSFEQAIFFLNALIGGLWLLPLFMIGHWLSGRRWVALLCAGLAVLFPQEVIRSSFRVFRFESLAVLIFLFQCALMVRLIQKPNLNDRRALWTLMVILHTVGLGVWRLYSPLIALMVGALILYEYLDGFQRASHLVSGSLAAAGMVSFFLYDYYYHGGWFERIPLAIPAVLYSLCALLFYSPAGKRTLRAAAGVRIILMLAMAAVFVTLLGWKVPFFRAKMLTVLGRPALVDFQTQFYAWAVAEHGNFDFSAFIKLPESPPLLLLVLLAPLLLYLNRRWYGSRLPEKGIYVCVILVLELLLLTTFFLRAAVVLIPLLFIISGAMLGGLLPEKLKRTVNPIEVAGLLALVVMAVALLFYAKTPKSSLCYQRDLPKEVFAQLSCMENKDAVIAAFWDMGFEIETYTGHRVLMDGFLENPVNIQRIAAFEAALFSKDERKLKAFMQTWHATHLLLDKRAYPRFRRVWENVQALASHGKPVEPSDSELDIPRPESEINFVRCAIQPGRSRFFRVAFTTGPYVVLEVNPD